MRLTAAAVLLLTLAVTTASADFVESRWHASLDRMWIGESYWANRLHDWRVHEGRLECVETRWLPMRTVHLLTHHVRPLTDRLKMDVTIGTIATEQQAATDSAAGFLIGVGGTGMDSRSAAIVHGFAGRGAGIFAGIDRTGQLVIRDNEHPLTEPKDLASMSQSLGDWSRIKLRLQAKPIDETTSQLSLNVEKLDGLGGAVASAMVPTARLTGNVALVSHPGIKENGETAGRFSFERWGILGDDLVETGTGGLGPIVSTQHTLSRGVMTMTAQLVPLGDEDDLVVRFDAGDAGAADAMVVRPGHTATFRVEGWPDDRDWPFSVSYVLRDRSGDATEHAWEGTIRRNPVDKPSIVLAGLSCNHNNSHNLGGGWGARDISKRGNWVEGMWFPHADLVERVRKHDPDVLFFAGDQIYEGASPSFADRKKIYDDYLYKWYLWCWAYRDLTRDIPCVVIPDDHDVYQGNLWGHGGRATKRDNQGGYVHPARFVKMVERTQTSHLPAPFDPRPIDQGIGVYFTDLNYGRVSFAVLEDRKFKSGCADETLPPSGTRRPDHFNDPEFDTTRLDLPHLKLLGDRQLAFLDAWAADWSNAEMKVALSQTVFANLATHHGGNLDYLIADLDSNGWPQSGRRRAIEHLRKALTIHVGGDQHLATLAQHGLDTHRDAIWSFCVPAAANFYPRQWLPPREGANRPAGAPPWSGDHYDGFRNLVTVFACTNPRETGREPKALHDGMPGYAIIRIDKPARTYTLECWPRYADPDASPGTGNDQYEGWPVTIDQSDNDGRTPTGWLPELRVSGLDDPVVRVYDEPSGELVYALRVRGSVFQPRVYGPGPFKVEVGCPDREQWKTFEHVGPVDASVEAFVEVPF
jgi:hypothetical protein